MRLHPCSSCARHVAATAPVCPFCSAVLAPPAPPPTEPIVGRVSRAAVFAGLTACWTGNPPAKQPPPTDDKQVVDKDITKQNGDNQDTPAGPVSITGVVTDGGTRSPLANVAVELRDANGQVAATNTDDTGKYQFAEIAPGDYQLVFKYGSSSAAGSAQRPVAVRGVAERVDVALPLVRRAPIPKPYGAPPARRRAV